MARICRRSVTGSGATPNECVSQSRRSSSATTSVYSRSRRAMRAATSDLLRRGATTRLHATRRVNWSCKSSFWVEITLLASCRECHSPWVLFSAGVRSPTRVATHCVCLQWWGQDAGPGHSASDQDAVFRAIKILSSAPRPPSGRSCPVPLSTFGRYWPPGLSRCAHGPCLRLDRRASPVRRSPWREICCGHRR